MKPKDLKKEKKTVLFARITETSKKRLLNAAKTSGYHSNQMGQFLEKLIKTALGVLIITSCSKEQQAETIIFTQTSKSMYSVCSPDVGKCVLCKLPNKTKDEAWAFCRDQFDKQVARVPGHYR